MPHRDLTLVESPQALQPLEDISQNPGQFRILGEAANGLGPGEPLAVLGLYSVPVGSAFDRQRGSGYFSRPFDMDPYSPVSTSSPAERAGSAVLRIEAEINPEQIEDYELIAQALQITHEIVAGRHQADDSAAQAIAGRALDKINRPRYYYDSSGQPATPEPYHIGGMILRNGLSPVGWYINRGVDLEVSTAVANIEAERSDARIWIQAPETIRLDKRITAAKTAGKVVKEGFMKTELPHELLMAGIGEPTILAIPSAPRIEEPSVPEEPRKLRLILPDTLAA